MFEGEYTPVGKVLYDLEVLEKIKYQRYSEYILRLILLIPSKCTNNYNLTHKLNPF
ncbi:hypothetical protein [Candidatus Pelagibacter ubique]|uniref:hypothetical protein n=1 Tax=Pelagibacter ubique TaxID=198252 RepID=UPI002A4E2CD8|nr:hypothetical protein [Candidatus Pelagibacter ubique]